MKKFFFAAAAIAALSATHAQASPAATNSCAAPQPAPAASYPMQPREFDKFEGMYRLKDGKVLALADRGGRFFARVGDTETEVVAVSAGAFMSRDARLTIDFDGAAARGQDILVRTQG